ncbi:MAG: CSLREA domain-containing protein [Solirubrobacterales bacterium]
MAPRIGIAFAALLVPLLVASWAGAATITVNSTSDVANGADGECTLREAITAANSDVASGVTGGECGAGSGPDAIGFSIPGSGPHVIAPDPDLPHLTTPMTIDGSTDPHQIALDGDTSTDPAPVGIYVTGDDVTVNDLTLARWWTALWITDSADSTVVSNNFIGTTPAGATGFGNTVSGVDLRAGVTNTAISDNVIAASGQDGIRINGDDTTDVRITGNWIGTDPSGTVGIGNVEGIKVTETDGTRIGGSNPADRNVISGNSGRGITVVSSISGDGPVEDLVIQGNSIGTDSSGLAALGNGAYGIDLTGDIRRTVVDDNVISGNGDTGIVLEDWVWDTVGPSDTSFRGNRIGVGVDGSTILNNGSGISVDSQFGYPMIGNRIGGTTGITPGGPCTGDCNLIAGNDVAGIYLNGDEVRASILGNEIRDNDSLGIELTPFTGPTMNDPGDTDIGSNELQNFPVFDAVWTTGGQTGITGHLDSTANTDFRIEVFANDAGDPTGYGEGQNFLDAFDLSTDGSGTTAFTRLLDQSLAPGVTLSATATKLDGSGVPGSTSEFGLNKGPTCDQSGGPGPDDLTASGGGQTLCGLGGEDALRGNTGGDILDGGPGHDTADLRLSSGGIVAVLDEDLAFGPDGTDVLFSIESLVGTAFNDVLVGDAGFNLILGDDGNDLIVPGVGSDNVLAGDGDDTIAVANGVADNEVNCGPGNDTVNADPVEIDADSIFIDCETINRPPVVDPPDPTCETDASLCPEPTCETDASLCPDQPDPVVYKCDGKVATIVGTNNSENLVGTDKRDIIVARAGADKIYPKGGNDIVCAGDGADVVKGKAGNDLIFGQGGADKLYGQDNKDTLNGGDGTDKLFGGDGADVLKGAGGNKDLLYGQGGFDKLDGGSKNGDVCNGGSGNDRKKAPGCEKKKRIP